VGAGILIVALLLTGCSTTSNERQIDGTVDTVTSHDDEWYIRLAEDPTTYECWVGRVPACATLKAGDVVSMEVATDNLYPIDNMVYAVSPE
jgi:hypothetical protein